MQRRENLLLPAGIATDSIDSIGAARKLISPFFMAQSFELS
jgi:hypothetical protein